MGRPKELSDAERADLRARGYKPVEVWVLDTDRDAFWAEVEAECRAIAQAEEEADVNLFIEASMKR